MKFSLISDMRKDQRGLLRQTISLEDLKEALHYDPETGRFTWVANHRKDLIGKRAGSITVQGYRKIVVDQVSYPEHRLAWFYMTGRWPGEDVDHRDRDRSNNSWNNLRAATRTQNLANSGKRAGKSSKYKGVSLHKPNGKWRVVLGHKGKQLHVGLFETEIEAARAYAIAAKETFGEFARSV